MTIDEQIRVLNKEVRCTIAPSSIHGIGVFALRDIVKGEELYVRPTLYQSWYTVPYERFNELRPEIAKLISERWNVLNGSSFKSPNDVWLVCFMNHSDTPNSDGTVALQNIAKGEEITEDYRVIQDYNKIYPFIDINKNVVY